VIFGEQQGRTREKGERKKKRQNYPTTPTTPTTMFLHVIILGALLTPALADVGMHGGLNPRHDAILRRRNMAPETCTPLILKLGSQLERVYYAYGVSAKQETDALNKYHLP
jgi:hypothetical protein